MKARVVLADFADNLLSLDFIKSGSFNSFVLLSWSLSSSLTSIYGTDRVLLSKASVFSRSILAASDMLLTDEDLLNSSDSNVLEYSLSLL